MCMCVSLGTCLPGCLCISKYLRPVFVSLNPLETQQTSAVCSLILEELNSGLLHTEEILMKSQLHRLYLDTESV